MASGSVGTNNGSGIGIGIGIGNGISIGIASGIECYPLGDSAVTIRWLDDQMSMTEANVPLQERVRAAADVLRSNLHPMADEIAAAYRTLTVYYDPTRGYGGRSESEPKTEPMQTDAGSPFEQICRWIEQLLFEGDAHSDSWANEPSAEISQPVVIPVCYGGEYGPDLEEMARRCGLTREEVIALHSSSLYTVAMIGFVPGFPYLNGLPQQLESPRRSEPRLSVAAGSVGIAGRQSGIYPLQSPGGWQLIGRTPSRIFDPMREKPSLLEPGDQIRFAPISAEQFAAIERQEQTGRERGAP
jgi:inhibitor of KinA